MLLLLCPRQHARQARVGPHGLWFLDTLNSCKYWGSLPQHALNIFWTCYYSELYPDDLSPSVANCCHQFHFSTVSFWMQGGSDGTAQGCCGRRKSAKHQFGGGGKGWWTISCSKFPRWKCKKKNAFQRLVLQRVFLLWKKKPAAWAAGNKQWQETMAADYERMAHHKKKWPLGLRNGTIFGNFWPVTTCVSHDFPMKGGLLIQTGSHTRSLWDKHVSRWWSWDSLSGS